MKILQLGKFYPIQGGVEKVMYDLTLGLSNRKVECDMLCTTDEKKSHVIKLNAYGKIMCAHSFKKIAATTLSSSIITTLRKICNDYDIIHVHHPDPMACLALYLSGYKGQVVVHWHSDIVKQKNLLKLYAPLQSWMLKRANLIIGTSPIYIKESPFLQKFQDKTTYLPIGIDKTHPLPLEVDKVKNEYAGKKIVFSVGRLVEYKGFSYLIESAKHLSDDYVVLIAGSGPLKGELQKQIDSNNLQHKVKLLGYISNNQKYGYYGASDVFCLSSIQKAEAFGIVQIEAMSCGKPVVATNIEGSGVSWVNLNNVSGLNVEPQNAKELAKAIHTICDDRVGYENYCTNANARFNYLFTISEMINKSITIYKELINVSEENSYSLSVEELSQKVV